MHSKTLRKTRPKLQEKKGQQGKNYHIVYSSSDITHKSFHDKDDPQLLIVQGKLASLLQGGWTDDGTAAAATQQS